MIRAVAAVDDRLGVGTSSGIPWSVPADVEHFRTLTASTDVVMGYRTYEEYAEPMPGRTNFVATASHATLREGFIAVDDVDHLIDGRHGEDLWVIGGAGLFASTLARTEEIHLTRISGDFGCSVFFPDFEAEFTLVGDESHPAAGAVPAFRFQTWRR